MQWMPIPVKGAWHSSKYLFNPPCTVRHNHFHQGAVECGRTGLGSQTCYLYHSQHLPSLDWLWRLWFSSSSPSSSRAFDCWWSGQSVSCREGLKMMLRLPSICTILVSPHHHWELPHVFTLTTVLNLNRAIREQSRRQVFTQICVWPGEQCTVFPKQDSGTSWSTNSCSLSQRQQYSWMTTVVDYTVKWAGTRMVKIKSYVCKLNCVRFTTEPHSA